MTDFKIGDLVNCACPNGVDDDGNPLDSGTKSSMTYPLACMQDGTWHRVADTTNMRYFVEAHYVRIENTRLLMIVDFYYDHGCASHLAANRTICLAGDVLISVPFAWLRVPV